MRKGVQPMMLPAAGRVWFVLDSVAATVLACRTKGIYVMECCNSRGCAIHSTAARTCIAAGGTHTDWQRLRKGAGGLAASACAQRFYHPCAKRKRSKAPSKGCGTRTAHCQAACAKANDTTAHTHWPAGLLVLAWMSGSV